MTAGLAGLGGVAMGAYASHGLSFIEPEAARLAARASLQSAVMYQMLHALALAAVAIYTRLAGPHRLLLAAGGLFTAGILLFSGLIYLRYLAGIETLRPLVPWGGAAWMAGWASLAVFAWRLPPRI